MSNMIRFLSNLSIGAKLGIALGLAHRWATTLVTLGDGGRCDDAEY